MFVKQIDMAKALELAAKGMEIKFEAGTETGQTGRGGEENECGHREDEGPAGGRMELCEDRG